MNADEQVYIDPDDWSTYTEIHVICEVEGCGWETQVTGHDPYGLGAKHEYTQHWLAVHQIEESTQ